jgi:hypothetical protein
MNISELLETILKGSKYLGTFPLAELLQYAVSRSVNGIAVAKDTPRERYLVFVKGEPEGAIYIDSNGTLYGDKAIMLIGGGEQFVLCDVKPDIVDALVMSCRVFEKSHLKQSTTYMVPEIGVKHVGIGVLTINLQRENAPINGVRVSIRKNGQIVGSDTTTGAGSVSFRVLHGTYTCMVQDRSQTVTNFQIMFDELHTKITLEL